MTTAVSKHTPGPWRIEGEEDRIVVWALAPLGRFHIADTVGGEIHENEDGDYADYGEVEANARLIAAAPELLETLREIAHSSHDCIVRDKARAAIAKATQP